MFERFDITKIIKDQMEILPHPHIYTIIAFIIATLLVLITKPLNPNLVNVLITAFAIFAGLLFNLIVILFDIFQKLKEDENQTKRADGSTIDSRVRALKTKKELSRETFISISFAILISISMIVILMVYSLDIRQFIPVAFNDKTIIGIKLINRYLITGLIYFLTTIFILTLYMILKRIHYLLITEVK